MKRRLILYLALQASFISPLLASHPVHHANDSSSSLAKSRTLDDAKPININNLFTYFRNNGDGSLNPYTNDDGVEYKPSAVVNTSSYGSYLSVGQLMFEEGVVWGGYHRGVLKIGGSTYNWGLQAGTILSAGSPTQSPVASDRSQPRYRIYAVRRDISSAVAFDRVDALLEQQEVPYIHRYENSMTSRALYDRYCLDWNEWPASDGAPYADVNHNGVYEPGIDVPGVPGADETLWYAANDLDSVRTRHLYGSVPIGIEMQKTIWAYHSPGALDNAIFQRTRLINKSGSQIDSMYIMQFSDPDIGGSLGYTDDYAGCDTLRNLGFVYNGTDNDGFFGSRAPAIGFDLLAGPMVRGSATDSAFVNFSYRQGYRNLPMTSMVLIHKIVDEPTLNSPRGTPELFNLMKGVLKTGAPVVNPQTGKVTTYVFPGDPVTQSGWIEGEPYNQAGLVYYPGDRRMCLTSGSFTMAPSDTQEFLVAEIVGAGANRIGSLALLQSNDDAIEKFYRNGFRSPATPFSPAVHVSQMDRHILLDWSDTASVSNAESFNSEGYRFQGYNLYQLPAGSFDHPKRLATYDVIDNVQWVFDTLYDASANLVIPVKTGFGTNSGVQRFYFTGGDSLAGSFMVNGKPYYFAVTSYAYNPLGTAGTKIIESAPSIVKAIPQTALPGSALHVQFGQVLSDNPLRVNRIGLNDHLIAVRVIDPAKLTGHTYAFAFSEPGVNASWSVIDSNLNRVIVRDQKNYTKLFYYYSGSAKASLNDPSDPIADGLQFSVASPPAAAPYRWTLSTAGLEKTFSSQAAVSDLQTINVFPNPYFAGSTLETNKYQHFVTFNHLPEHAVIHIFTLNGTRLRVLIKNDPSQFMTWDLTNESGAQVGAGMYVIYISMPELGTQKILKLAIIPAVTIPDHW